jgi:RNA polymerase sigma-70 factor (ECF subfamily)
VSVKERLTGERAEAFVRVYNSYYSLIFSSIRSRVENFHDAEDICQEVFIRLYDRFDEVDNPRKWIYGCLRLVVLEHYRARYSRDVNVDELLDDIGMGYVNGFREARIMIRDTLDELRAEGEATDIPLFELVSVYHYSLAEAARHLGITYKQARYRYSLTAQRLADGLKKKGVKGIEDLL